MTAGPSRVASACPSATLHSEAFGGGHFCQTSRDRHVTEGVQGPLSSRAAGRLPTPATHGREGSHGDLRRSMRSLDCARKLAPLGMTGGKCRLAPLSMTHRVIPDIRRSPPTIARDDRGEMQARSDRDDKWGWQARLPTCRPIRRPWRSPSAKRAEAGQSSASWSIGCTNGRMKYPVAACTRCVISIASCSSES